MEPSEYQCLNVVSAADESEDDFSARLSRFWTEILRRRPDDFEKVYAESIGFERKGSSLRRTYLIFPEIADWLTAEMSAAGVRFDPIDSDDLMTKYEAVPAEWMQIEH